MASNSDCRSLGSSDLSVSMRIRGTATYRTCTPGLPVVVATPTATARYRQGVSASEAPGMTKGRLEAFSDGVFAVAATLLVVELHVPDQVTSDLGGALLAQWPSYLAYVTSFLTIGIIWVNHHQLFAHVRAVDRPLLFVNLFLLMTVSLVPFPTALLGRFATAAEDGHVASALYGAVMVLMSIAFSALWLHITRDTRLIGHHLDPHRARHEGMLFSAGLAAYLAGIGLSMVSAQLALLLYALVAVFYVFPWLPPVREAPG
jgi:TMEM175 potassium channel family protein